MNPGSFIRNQMEYIHRPSNLLNRWKFKKLDKHAPITVSLRGNRSIQVRLCEPVGRSVFLYHFYDLAMSEVLYRLTDPKDKVLDVGANVGYTTLIMSLKALPENITSFEPHPVTFGELNHNIHILNKLTKINLLNIGISSESSKKSLVTRSPDHRGASKIADGLQPSAGAEHKDNTLQIEVRKLDDLMDHKVGVMKIDVEGHELNVMRGAENLLAKKMIRDIVFEEHRPYPSATYTCLENYGYKIYRIGKGFYGPQLIDKENHSSYSISWEPENYLATINPQRAKSLLHKKGWYFL